MAQIIKTYIASDTANYNVIMLYYLLFGSLYARGMSGNVSLELLYSLVEVYFTILKNSVAV